MILDPPERLPTLSDLGHLHLVGIGGVAMSAIARYAFERGLTVSGSETRESAVVDGLAALGITCYRGHRPANLDGADTVVVSTATPDDNIEVVEARRRGLTLLHRATATAALAAGFRTVAVAGTHGKTSTCAMLATALAAEGEDPSFIVGGVMVTTGTNAHAGTGPDFIIEADESDGAFLQLSPSVAMVTNVDPDHLELYGDDPAAYHAAFDTFADHVVDGGVLIACIDDPGSRALAERAAARGIRVVRYGEDEQADIVFDRVELRELSSRLRIRRGTEVIGELELAVPGRHFASNAVGAVAVLLELGRRPDVACAGIAGYRGTRRRFEFKGAADYRGGRVRVFDDYGHHPTEIVATLTAARRSAGGGRVIVLFRPLRHTRTLRMGAQLGHALEVADAVVVLDPSGDAVIDGVDGTLVADHVGLPPGAVVYEPDFDAGPARVAALVEPGDLVVTLGAGDVAVAGPVLLGLLESGQAGR